MADRVFAKNHVSGFNNRITRYAPGDTISEEKAEQLGLGDHLFTEDGQPPKAPRPAHLPDFDEMPLRELRAWAGQNNIDLSNVDNRNKYDVAAAIKQQAGLGVEVPVGQNAPALSASDAERQADALLEQERLEQEQLEADNAARLAQGQQ